MARIGTEAASSLAMFLAKGVTFHQLGVLDNRAVMQGLLIGVFVLTGSTLSKRLVQTAGGAFLAVDGRRDAGVRPVHFVDGLALSGSAFAQVLQNIYN